jgi:hypothetical protein
MVFQGEEETQNSFTAIASHVTEYARFYLWELFEKAGIENVYYCDTDSLFIPKKYMKRLKSVMHKTRLGALSLKGEATDFQVFGAKDYIFDGKKTLKGIRSDAEEIEENVFRQLYFPSLKTLLREENLDGFPIKRIIKKLSREYRKGTVTDSGIVEPLVFPLA